MDLSLLHLSTYIGKLDLIKVWEQFSPNTGSTHNLVLLGKNLPIY